MQTVTSRDVGAEGAVVEPAPAKINLYLHVTGRRADGYHELDSWVVFSSIGDTISVRRSDAVSLQVDGPFGGDVPATDDNLACRAARSLAEALDRPDGVAIRLTKTLPVAAGIGGGSADAAAVLRALFRLWDVPLDPGLLHAIAARIGADVPACVRSDSCFMGGIGDDLVSAPSVAGCPVVLANPRVPVPTASVFRARDGAFSSSDRPSAAPNGPADLADLLAQRRNDLSLPAHRLYPPVKTVETALEALPGCLLARMSGSGGTCFAIFDTDAAADAGARTLSARHPEWWVRSGDLL